mmetsp:Transcript_7425/g.9208  ORF Transcript_7425/g.9208 Transcript_7425/m.9208 type:complete len:118 (-) Transcript_7425:15-368(-)
MNGPQSQKCTIKISIDNGNELSLEFDKDGRIGGVDYSEMKFDTRINDGCFSEEHVSAARCEIEKLLPLDDELDASFWMPATVAPESILELMAQTIFRTHTAGVPFDPHQSGAEWWVG